MYAFLRVLLDNVTGARARVENRAIEKTTVGHVEVGLAQDIFQGCVMFLFSCSPVPGLLPQC